MLSLKQLRSKLSEVYCRRKKAVFFNEMNARMDKKCNAWIVGEVKENCDVKEGSREER